MVSLIPHFTACHEPNGTRRPMNTNTVNANDSTHTDQREACRSYRPQYPVSLFQRIYTYHIINGGTFEGTAHDAGCGPGITAAILALQFKHVMCSDLSQKAIDSARINLLGSAHVPCKSSTNANFTFKVSSAEDMSWISPGSIDMVTMSEALHWTDTSRTIAAAAQALKSGGTFAAWYYTQPRLPDNPAADRIFRDLNLTGSGYDCVAFPLDVWEGVQRIKVNTNGNKDVWVRDWDLAHMRFESQAIPSDKIEYIEDAKDWQQVNLDWLRGWFESLFPKIDSSLLKEMLVAMEAALGPQGTTRAAWPVVILLASKKS